jgi:hypothetical protein
MDLIEKILKERAAYRAQAAALAPETRRFNTATLTRFIIVSPSCLAAGWRATLFDELGAVCHTETRDHAAAVMEARAYGADIFNPITE